MPSKKPLPRIPEYSTEELEEICVTKKVPRTNIRRLGRLLSYFEDHLDNAIGPEPAVFRDWIIRIEGVDHNLKTAHAYLHATSRTFRMFYGSSPFLRAMDEATLLLWHEIKPPKDKADHKPKTLTFSLPVNALPANWQEAIEDMGVGNDGIEQHAPAPSLLKTQIRKICELAKICVDGAHDINLTIETVTAYERSLLSRERPLSPTTVKSSIRHIRDFALYLGATEPVADHLRSRVRFHEGRTANALPLKEQKIRKIPTYTEIFEDAFDLLGRANVTNSKRVAQRCRNFATALTLMCPFPLRVADSCLRFGENLTWNGEGYHLLVAATSKTGEPFHARIAPFFGMFIDQLVLQGADSDYLEDLRERAIRQQRLLFENPGSNAVFDGYVSYAWRETYGTGSHIARTKIHDELAIHGLKGVEGALRACGHRSERSAEHYRTRAFTLLAGDHVRKTAEQGISEDEWGKYFDTAIN